jgi:hypothetical protein
MHHWRTVGPNILVRLLPTTMLRMVPGLTPFLRAIQDTQATPGTAAPLGHRSDASKKSIAKWLVQKHRPTEASSGGSGNRRRRRMEPAV